MRARRSVFVSAAPSTIHKVEGSGLELYGLRLLRKKPDELRAVAERMIELATNAPALIWLPGPKERYSSMETAPGALDRAAKKKNAIAWLIQRTGEHSERNECSPEAVEGIASMHEGIRVAVGCNEPHRYVLASFWTAGDTPFPDQLQIAHAMFHTLPRIVCPSTDRIVASLDGPLWPSETEPADPSAALGVIGELWPGARVLDGPAEQLDGIITNSTTRLYRPMTRSTYPSRVEITEQTQGLSFPLAHDEASGE